MITFCVGDGGHNTVTAVGTDVVNEVNKTDFRTGSNGDAFHLGGIQCKFDAVTAGMTYGCNRYCVGCDRTAGFKCNGRICGDHVLPAAVFDIARIGEVPRDFQTFVAEQLYARIVSHQLRVVYFNIVVEDRTVIQSIQFCGNACTGVGFKSFFRIRQNFLICRILQTVFVNFVHFPVDHDFAGVLRNFPDGFVVLVSKGRHAHTYAKQSSQKKGCLFHDG